MAFPNTVVALPDPATRTDADGASLRAKLSAIFAPWKEEIEGLRTKVGYTSSTDPVSLDYKTTRVVENVRTSNYTLALSDAGTVVAMDLTATNTITIPPNSAVPFPIGTVIEGFALGTGQTTTAAGTNVTLLASGSRLKSAARYATWGYRKRATDTWVVSGDLVS